MKTLKILSLALLTLISFNSCEDDNNFAISGNDADSAVITFPESGTVLVLDIANPMSTAATVVWDDAAYTTPTAINYTAQLALANTDFAIPINAGTTTNNFLSWTNEELNTVVVGDLGLPPFEETDVELRIVSTIGEDNVEMTLSETIILTITPYTTEAPKLYVVGNFLAASGYGSDWTPADAVPIASSGFGETDFEGYVYMNVDSPEFKILPTNESFDGDYGDDGTFSGTLIQEGESNIQVSGPGYYFIKVDLTNPDAITYSAEITNWAVTGSATPAGWPDNGVQDQDMTYNVDTGKWEITIALTAGADDAFKFRANDGWALNYGDAGRDGVLDFNDGTNLTVETAGTYLIEVDFSNPRMYTYTATLQ